VSQSRIEGGIHSLGEVAAGAALGSGVTFAIALLVRV
jgi:membrane-associated phospholipid phosphatase